MEEPYIPLDKCVDGNLYRIRARNGRFGVFIKGEGKTHHEGNDAFRLSRHKFGSNYLFDEFHWDTGAPFGTVHPEEDLGPAPKFDTEGEMLEYLNGLTENQREEDEKKSKEQLEAFRKKQKDELQ